MSRAEERILPGLGPFSVRLFLVALAIISALVLWRLRDAVTVAFGSVILAIGFRGLGDAVGRRLRVPAGVSLAVAIAVILGLLALSIEVFGQAMATQFGELGLKLPEGLHAVVARLKGYPLARDFIDQARESVGTAATGPAARMAGRLITAISVAISYALMMIAGGVFLAIEPSRYREGFIRLLPRSRRARAVQVLAELTDTLRRWLIGRVVVMVAVGVLSSLGLWALGIDAPFALGLTGAVLTFIPTVGSIMSAVPGMLIGFMQEPIKAVAVALVFWAVHFVEGTFITPYVQDESVDIPPFISIFSTVVFGVLLGAGGVLLTGPITVVAMVLVERLYVEDVLGETVAEPRRKAAKGWFRRLTTAGGQAV